MSGGGRHPLAGVVGFAPRWCPPPRVQGWRPRMARGNFLRSLAAASLIVASGAAGLLAVSSLPAATRDNLPIPLHVPHNRFRPTHLSAPGALPSVSPLDRPAPH